MRVSRLTDKSIKAYKSNSKDEDYTEAGGFGVRVRKTGAKSFYYRYRFKGKVRFMTLGVYGSTSLAEARDNYNQAYQLREKGFDPMVVAKEKEAAEQKHLEEALKIQADESNARESKALTVSKLIDLYIENHAKTQKKTWHKDELVLRGDVIKAWGDRPATELEKSDLLILMQQIIKRGAPGQAQNVLEAVRAMFNWAVDTAGHLKATPFVQVKRATKKTKGDRALGENEISILWNELDEADMSDEIKRALKLTLVTIQRPGECISIHKEDVDGHWWTIPSEKSKNGMPHRIYLTDLALEVIGDLEPCDTITGERIALGYIFRCPNKKKEKPILEGSMGQAVRKNLESGKITVKKFTPHDLRRTGVTHLARLKIPKEWRERIVNHLPEELDAIYNLYEYDAEKEEAKKKWEVELRRILNMV